MFVTAEMGEKGIFKMKFRLFSKDLDGKIYKKSKFTKKVLTKVCGGG